MPDNKFSLVTGFEELAIERQILRLLTLFVHKMDDGKLDEVADMFSHADYEVRGIRYTGRDAVESCLIGSARRHDGGSPGTIHVISNALITIDALGDRASCVSYYMVRHQLDDLPLHRFCDGRYYDTFELHNGQWRFSSRRDEPRSIGCAPTESPVDVDFVAE